MLIDVSDKEVLRRLGGRRVCACGQTYHLVFNPPQQLGVCDACGKKLHARPEDNLKAIKLRLSILFITYFNFDLRLYVFGPDLDGQTVFYLPD